MSNEKWGAHEIPDVHGKVALITGGNTGLGKENARVLANAGMQVILGVRSAEKGETAAAEIRQECPSANVLVKTLDLANLASVRSLVDDILANCDRLDLLINNAGVMMCPYAKTADGFEMQFGTNHLGHFALTLGLLPKLKETPDSRIVIVSSLAHKQGNLNMDDLNWQNRKYNTGHAYGDSKLANMLFARGLAQRLASSGNHPLVTVAHPGVTQTDLARHSKIGALLTKLLSQDVEHGALPSMRAAFDPAASPGDLFGPGGFMEMRGYPKKVQPASKALDDAAVDTLWRMSETMTGVSLPN